MDDYVSRAILAEHREKHSPGPQSLCREGICKRLWDESQPVPVRVREGQRGEEEEPKEPKEDAPFVMGDPDYLLRRRRRLGAGIFSGWGWFR